MRYFVILLVMCLALFAGCTEEQQQQVDEVAEIAQGVTEKGEAIVNSPVGDMIPPGYKFWIVTGGFLLNGLTMAWTDYRRRVWKTGLSEVVIGNEREGAKGTNFKTAQASAQSAKTEILVNKVKQKI